MLGAERARGAAARSLALARLVGRELVPCGRDQPSARLTAARSAPANDTGRPIVASIEHRGYAPADELRHTVVRGWVMGVRSFRRATTVAAFMPITSSA